MSVPLERIPRNSEHWPRPRLELLVSPEPTAKSERIHHALQNAGLILAVAAVFVSSIWIDPMKWVSVNKAVHVAWIATGVSSSVVAAALGLMAFVVWDELRRQLSTHAKATPRR